MLMLHHQAINEDILLEIFIRLPDSRSVIRFSSVCKHWFSIIHSAHYKKRLKLLRDESKSQSESEFDPFTIIFRRNISSTPLYEYHFPKEYSQKMKISSSSSSSSDVSYLGFLPWPNVRLHGVTGDLLLVSDKECRIFVICNPFTQQWIDLPQIPLDDNVDLHLYTYFVRGGLVLLEPNNPQRQLNRYNYKVMILWKANYYTSDLHAITFCSESGKWSRIFKSLSIPNGLNYNPPVVFNGILHWLSLDCNCPTVHGISALDPFKHTHHPKYFRFINFPFDLEREAWKSNLERVRLGLIQGRLRLSQLHVTKTYGFVLKVWELNYDKDNDIDNDNRMWTLLHDVTVKRWTDNRHYVIGFHPNNGNVLFMLHRKRSIYQYDIGNEKMIKVGRFPDGGDRSFPLYLRTYLVMHHHLWPTPISALSYH